MLIKVKDIFFLFLLLFSFFTSAQTKEYKLKAAYIEKFSRFIEWPFESSPGDTLEPFNITVIGYNPFDNFLNEELIKRIKKIKSRNISVRYVNKIEDIGNSQILFISKSEAKRINQILEYTKNKPILTVGDTQGFAEKGVMINLYNDDDFIKFEISEKAVNSSKLKVSSKLLKLAKIVE